MGGRTGIWNIFLAVTDSVDIQVGVPLRGRAWVVIITRRKATFGPPIRARILLWLEPKEYRDAAGMPTLSLVIRANLRMKIGRWQQLTPTEVKTGLLSSGSPLGGMCQRLPKSRNTIHSSHLHTPVRWP